MKILMLNNGRVFQGNQIQIVEAMQYRAFGQEGRTIIEYIDWAVGCAGRLNDIHMKVEGKGDEERSASFIEAMLTMGLAEEV